ncbi:MAG: hypothetical protein IKT78_02600 [Ruminiclostridium sp.]|nr:hypothetical protein [Ruminiclostridium sp.]
MFICNKCGNRFCEEELDYISVDYGECWGYTAYRRQRCCPLCKGDVEEDEDIADI